MRMVSPRHTFVDSASPVLATDAPEGNSRLRSAADQRVFDLVARGVNSGKPVLVDATYFAGLRARIQSKHSD